ncbi:hypothetical protein [Streptomyces sp. NPDC001930]|uniref:hypothetical protein n=1 Tax=Streptomyces sp. NPDC001930 TaxID=3364625 RepID=UPI0036A5E918
MPPTRASRPKLPTTLQFVLAPRVMRRIALFQLDHQLDFQDARRWYVTALLYRWHLERVYGPQWKRTAPPAEVTAANWWHFHPAHVPDGPGRDLVQAVLAVTSARPLDGADAPDQAEITPVSPNRSDQG